MEQIHVREANSEVLIYLDRNTGDYLHALEEAARVIEREIWYEKSRLGLNPNR